MKQVMMPGIIQQRNIAKRLWVRTFLKISSLFFFINMMVHSESQCQSQNNPLLNVIAAANVTNQAHLPLSVNFFPALLVVASGSKSTSANVTNTIALSQPTKTVLPIAYGIFIDNITKTLEIYTDTNKVANFNNVQITVPTDFTVQLFINGKETSYQPYFTVVKTGNEIIFNQSLSISLDPATDTQGPLGFSGSSTVSTTVQGSFTVNGGNVVNADFFSGIIINVEGDCVVNNIEEQIVLNGTLTVSGNIMINNNIGARIQFLSGTVAAGGTITMNDNGSISLDKSTSEATIFKAKSVTFSNNKSLFIVDGAIVQANKLNINYCKTSGQTIDLTGGIFKNYAGTGSITPIINSSICS